MAMSKITNQQEFDNIRYQTVGDKTYSSGVVVLSNEYVESRRWTEMWELVWSENEGKDLFSYYYHVPATELQDVDEDFNPSEIRDVVAEEVTIIKYTRVYPKKKSSKK